MDEWKFKNETTRHNTLEISWGAVKYHSVKHQK